MGNLCFKKKIILNKNVNINHMDNYDENTPMFSLKNYIVKGKVVSVYDGDTVKIVFPFHDTYYKWNCRLTGIDTPELRTRNEKEKKYGYIVRDKLREKILNKIVKVECGEFDKYGRLLTTIICIEDECNVNNWLIENKYALEYDGGTKSSWEDVLKDSSFTF